MKSVIITLLCALGLSAQGLPNLGGFAGSTGGWGFVNANNVGAASFGTTHMTLSVTAGNFLYCSVGDNSGGTVLGISDSASNTYVTDGGIYSPGSFPSQQWHVASLATTATITISFTSNAGSGGLPQAVCLQFVKPAGGGALVSAPGIVSAGGGPGTATTASFSPTAAVGALCIQSVYTANGSSTFTAGTTNTGQTAILPSGASIPPGAGNGTIGVQYAIANATTTTLSMQWSLGGASTISAAYHQ